MNEEVRKAAQHFFNAVKETCDHNTVSCSLFINSGGFTITFDSREHQALIDSNITMKNIKGEWV